MNFPLFIKEKDPAVKKAFHFFFNFCSKIPQMNQINLEDTDLMRSEMILFLWLQIDGFTLRAPFFQ